MYIQSTLFLIFLSLAQNILLYMYLMLMHTYYAHSQIKLLDHFQKNFNVPV